MSTVSTTTTYDGEPFTIPDFPYADLLDGGPFHDWRDDLREHGYAIVKAIPRERALEYRQRAFDWLESWDRGFDRTDPSTFGDEHLPVNKRGGMYFQYGFAQEQWVWDIRCEPGVKEAFETLWNTDRLVSSMDGGAIMLPGRPPIPAGERSWKHIDLCPSRKGFFVAQGIVNLNDNGPDDGGLVVIKGSSRLIEQYFNEKGRPPLRGSGKQIDWHAFDESEMEWFYERGCELVKVCAEPGDLILWDSATIHQNCPPSGSRDRIVTYVCMGPADLVTEEDLAVRQLAFNGGFGTSHAPFHGTFVLTEPAKDDSGQVDPAGLERKNLRKETDEVLRLAGLKAY
ncbi:uncharacterized protein JCM15063_005684 [Sporobolomyces koalae]|uniref:uncharacterized protein n=1 Tax=Sporobolomyces koalae TaxID=500713 RepID=UPI00317B352E